MSQRECVYRYKQKHYKRIPLEVKLEDYELMQKRAEELGKPINTYIKDLIKEDLNG